MRIRGEVLRARMRPLFAAGPWIAGCVLALATSAVLATSAALAQGQPGQRPGAGHAAGQGARPADDEEMRAALEQVMLVRLKRTLALTPEQEPRIMPRIKGL